MKNARIFVILCVLLLTAAVLSSCSLIDELKEQRFEWKDSSVLSQTVVYKNKEYKRIENDFGRHIRYESDVVGYVVDDEVPLLWMSLMGASCHYDEDIDMVMCNGYFFPEERYEYYSNLIETAVLDYYKIDYSYYDYEDDEYKTIFYVLDKKETDLINGTLDNVEKKAMDESSNSYAWERMRIDECYETGVIYNTGNYELFRDRSSGICGIVVYDSDENCYYIYEIPENYRSTIEKLFDKYYKESTFEAVGYSI